MAYAFNDDKSKAEVYTKGDFIILEDVVTNVPNRGGTGNVSFTAQQLGVGSLDDIVVLSVAQALVDSDPKPYRYECTYGTDLSGMTTYHNNYPMTYVVGNQLYISVLNPSEETTGSANIYYRLVLLKIN